MIGLSLAFLATAQDGPEPKRVPPELIKEAPDKEAPDKKLKLPDELIDPKLEKAKDAAKGESPKEIIERLHKNMEKANVQLKDKADPTELTRRLQSDIIDDLEKLIKQQKDNESC